MIDRIDSVFLFGTGIVSGPWEPVLRALAKKYKVKYETLRK